MKTRTARVINNRALLKCPECMTQDRYSVQPREHTKKIKCRKCGVWVSCRLNRRQYVRTTQAGRARVTIIVLGQEVFVRLRDVSYTGVGLDVERISSTNLVVGQEVYIDCDWDRRLFKSKKYKIVSIKEARVGAQIM